MAHLTEAASGPKGEKILWNYELEDSSKELNCMVYFYTLFIYPYWVIALNAHTYASDKHLGDFIGHNNKPIAFFSSKLIKPQRNYNTTKKEILTIVEFLKQFRGVLFGYEIIIFSYHKNMVYAATLNEYQRVMRW